MSEHIKGGGGGGGATANTSSREKTKQKTSNVRAPVVMRAY